MLYLQSCYKQEDYKCPALHQQVTNGRVSNAQHLTNKLRKGQLQVSSTSPTICNNNFSILFQITLDDVQTLAACSFEGSARGQIPLLADIYQLFSCTSKKRFQPTGSGEPRPSGAPSKRVMRRNERLCRLGLRRCRYFQETQRRL